VLLVGRDLTTVDGFRPRGFGIPGILLEGLDDNEDDGDSVVTGVELLHVMSGFGGKLDDEEHSLLVLGFGFFSLSLSTFNLILSLSFVLVRSKSPLL